MRVRLSYHHHTRVDETQQKLETLLGADMVMVVPDGGDYEHRGRAVTFLDDGGEPLFIVQHLRTSSCLVAAASRKPGLVVGFPQDGKCFVSMNEPSNGGNCVYLGNAFQVSRIPEGADFLTLAVRESVLSRLTSNFGGLWETPQALMRIFVWSDKRHAEAVTRIVWSRFSREFKKLETGANAAPVRPEEVMEHLARVEEAISLDICSRLDAGATFSRDPAEAVVAQCQALQNEIWFRAVSTRELSEMTGYSQQKIYQGFDSLLGMSPREWHLISRLGLARQKLKRACPYRVKVADVAFGLGFRHLGRFSDSYRRIFKEYPSATLRKG